MKTKNTIHSDVCHDKTPPIASQLLISNLFHIIPCP